MKIKNFFNIDFSIFISMLTLMIIGVMFIYSSGISSTGQTISNEYIYQIIWIISGLVLFFIVMFSDYSLFRKWSLYIYLGSIIILILTLFFGREVNGSKSWFGFFGFGIQPSEFTKIAVILFLSDYYVTRKKTIRTIIHFFNRHVYSFFTNCVYNCTTRYGDIPGFYSGFSGNFFYGWD